MHAPSHRPRRHRSAADGESLGRLSAALADHRPPAVDCAGARIVGVVFRGIPREMLCLELAFASENPAAVLGRQCSIR